MTGQTWKALLKATAPATMPLFLFSLAVNLLLLTVPIYMMQVFDRVLSGGRLETLLWLSVIAAVALAVYALLDAVRDGLVTQTGQWLHRRLSTRVIKATLGISRGGGTITLQPMLDLRLIRTFAGGQPIKVFFDAPWTVLFLGVLFLIHWLFGLIAFVSLLALITLALVNAYLTKRPNADGATAERRSTSVLEGALGSAEAIGAMGLDAGVQRLWAERQDDADRLTAMGAERSSRCLAFSKFLRLTIQMAVLGLGAVLVLRGQMTAGAMIAASILMSRTLAPFEQSITAWNSFTQARGAFERIGRLLAAAPRLSDHPELPQPEGRLSFDKAVYGVPGRERPLAGPLQLEFEPGTIAAIVGPSGAGKTTLCRLAGGVWNPSYGKVRLDGAELGVWPPEQLGGLVGYLPQDVQLVGDTVHDAISRLEPDAPFEEVVAAAMLAGLHEEIKSWPQAYRTPIGAGGRALSAGQRQRLGLARALYRRPKLILLDEPNANLDDEGQKALREALVQAKAWSATIIMVTHHLGILQIADRVIRMEEGRVVADETGQEVLQRLKSIALRREGTVQQDPKPRLPGADPTVSANDRAKGQAE